MVRVSQSLLKAIDATVSRGWFKSEELSELLEGGENSLHVLLEGYTQGYYDLEGEDTFRITEKGRRLYRLWELAGKPEADPWVDSRVMTMMRALVYGGEVPDAWRPVLEDRNLLTSEGELSEVALELVDTLLFGDQRPVVTKSMARQLLKVPQGPARRDEYGERLPIFEAMDLVTGSVPNNAFYSLTSTGRLMKRLVSRLNLDAPFPSVVNARVINAVQKLADGVPVSEEDRKMLGLLGYLKPTGELDHTGRLLLRILELYRNVVRSPPAALSAEDEKLLLVVSEVWEESSRNPNIQADKETIAKRLREKYGIDNKELSLSLLHLESMGLIDRVEEKKDVFKPTQEGKRLARAPGAGNGAPVLAVKTLTLPWSFESPSVEWIGLARDKGIVGVNGPTKRGEELARLSQTPRKPLITRYEVRVLQRIPSKKSVARSTLEEIVPSHAIDRLEARGLIESLPNGRIILTRVGALLKNAVAGVSPGIAVPVSPLLVRVLKAVKDLRSDDVARIVNETKLTLGEVKDALLLARAAKFLGRSWTLTGEGEMLLEALEMMAQYGVSYEEGL